MGETVKETKQKKSWFKGLKAEFKKIIWPDRNSLVKETTAVLVVSVLLSSIYTRSMVFTHLPKAQLPFALFRDLFNDTAEFTSCYGLHDCSHLLSRLLYPLA